MKKTAVQWLLEQYLKKDGLTKSDVKNATEMEKQQITDAYAIGCINGEMIERDLQPKYTNPIQYYNEIFIKNEIE